MKKSLWLLLFLIPVEISYSNVSVKPIVVETEVVRSESYVLDSLLYVIDSVSIDSLKKLIAFKEYNGKLNPYTVVNQYGMLGKYQFSPTTLSRLGYDRLVIKNFLGNEIVQEEAMNKLLMANYSYIKRVNLLKYVGKNVGGVRITLSGMLAGSHLVGVASVRHYLNNKGNMDNIKIKRVDGSTVLLRKVDANGTSIKRYLSILE